MALCILFKLVKSSCWKKLEETIIIWVFSRGMHIKIKWSCHRNTVFHFSTKYWFCMIYWTSHDVKTCNATFQSDLDIPVSHKPINTAISKNCWCGWNILQQSYGFVEENSSFDLLDSAISFSTSPTLRR